MPLRVVTLLLLSLLSAAANCGQDESTACGMQSALPDTPSGTLQATRDGSPYTANTGLRGYRLQSDRTDIVAGDVTLAIGKDQDGNNVAERINAGEFPICILLNDQADGTTYAMANASGKSFITDSTHTGTVAILAKEGDELVGRFAFEALMNQGTETTRFEDGSFRLGAR